MTIEVNCFYFLEIMMDVHNGASFFILNFTYEYKVMLVLGVFSLQEKQHLVVFHEKTKYRLSLLFKFSCH